MSMEPTPKVDQRWTPICLVLAAVMLRLLLSRTPAVSMLAARPEIVSPSDDFMQLREAAFLWRDGVAPYDGSFMRLAPLLIPLALIPEGASTVLFVLADVLVAIAIFQVARKADHFCPAYPGGAERPAGFSATLLMAMYLFNPGVVAACVAKSTLVFTNAAVICTGLCAMLGKSVPAMLGVATAGYLCCHSLVLLPSVILLLNHARGEPVHWLLITTVLAAGVAVLLGASLAVTEGDWRFMHNVYWSTLTMENLRPNTGLHWYLFQQMFTDFRPFFLGVCNTHVACVAIPMAVRFPHHPLMVWCSTVAGYTIFKPSTIAADLGFYLPVVLLLAPYLHRVKLQFTVLVALCTSCMSFGITWSLWVHSGVGNANTFFTTTVIYNAGQIIFVCNAARSYIEVYIADEPTSELTTEPVEPAPEKSEELQQKEQQRRKQQQDQLLLMRGAKVDQLNIDRFLMLDRSLGGTLQRRKNKATAPAQTENHKELQQALRSLREVTLEAEARLESEWLSALGSEFASRLSAAQSKQVIDYLDKRCHEVVAGGASGLEYAKLASEFVACSERCFARTKARIKERVEKMEMDREGDKSDGVEPTAAEGSKKKGD